MKKHFLLLLMAFFSLAGWAATTVTLYDFTVPYGTVLTVDNLPDDAWQVTGDLNKEEVKEYLTFARVDDGSATWNSNNVGVYSWTLTKAADTGGYTIYLSSNNAKLTIAKATITESEPGELAHDCPYSTLANPLQLVTTAPTLSLAEAQSTIEYSLDGESWSTTKPSIKKVGNHTVYYRVPEASNWNAKASVAIGTVEILGTYLVANTDYTAPELVAGDLSFQWDNVNGKAVEQTLITAGTTPTNHGELWYCVDGGEWSKNLPTASTAGDHVVSWKVVGDEGYYDVAPANLTAKNIAAVQPTVTAATGATSLVWTGEAQELLSGAGSATLGATPTYSVKYSATNLDDWGTVASEAKATKADVKGTDAGFYQVTTLVATDGNYVAAAATPIVVQIGTKAAFTAAPTAADLTWNNAAQQLIVAGEGTVAGIVKYQLNDGAWTTDITTIKGSDAGNYTVKYKVDAANYTPVEATAIADVKINKKVLSVKVNDYKKTYDGNANVTGGAVVGGAAAFTYIGRVEATLDFSTVAYDAIDDANKTAGTHEGVLKATTASLNAVSENYDYTIIPGTLTVEKKALTITANQPLSATYHTAYDISGEYSNAATAGVITGETYANVFAEGKLPVLTTNAAATNPEPGDYTLAFTEGVLVENPNYTVAYVIPDGAKFVVTPDPSSKIVITVLPKTITYGDAEDYTNFVAGTDYYVTGLIGDDVLTTAPTFSRSDASNKNVGTYDLIAENAAVADLSKYPGGFVYNNSTFEITPAELVATVNQQTVVKDATVEALDQTAWSVEGLKGSDKKADLGGTLAFDGDPTVDTGLKEGKIVLAITNTNYTLKAGSQLGDLLVISATDFALDPTDTELPSKLAVADGHDGYSVVFTNQTTTIGEWYAMVLPFDVDPLKMVQAFGRYVIFNELNTAGTDDGNFKFTLTLDKIPAGKPFLIKFAKKDGDTDETVVNWASEFNKATYGTVTIKKDIVPTTTDYVDFTGTYTAKDLKGLNKDGAGEKVWWLAQKAYKGDNNWKKPKTNMHTAAPMEAYLTAEGKEWTSYAPNITVEDFDGQTTAIKSLSADKINNLNVVTEGWYTVGGMKLQGAPTQKGVYINNGKKIVVK